MDIKEITGMVDEILSQQSGTGKKGKWTMTRFRLKTLDNKQVKVGTFEAFDKNLVGQFITITGVYDAKYYQYNASKIVKAENVTLPALPSPAPVAEAKPVRKKRIITGASRTGKSTEQKFTKTEVEALEEPALKKPIQTDTTRTSELEEVRSESEHVIQKDLLFASAYLGNDASAEAKATLVQALQAVRATIYIERNKRSRVADMKAGR